MAQHVGHLFERTAATQQTAGHGVAQQVRSRIRKSGPRVRLADRLAHQIRADRLITRGDMAHEYRAVAGLRAFELEIIGDGLAGGYRQGQYVFAPALGSPKRNRTGASVDVVQAKLRDLAAA